MAERWLPLLSAAAAAEAALPAFPVQVSGLEWVELLPVPEVQLRLVPAATEGGTPRSGARKGVLWKLPRQASREWLEPWRGQSANSQASRRRPAA